MLSNKYGPLKNLNVLQVRVKYAPIDFKNDSENLVAESEWRDLSRIDMTEEEMHKDTPLLVNIKGECDTNRNSFINRNSQNILKNVKCVNGRIYF